MGAVSIGVRGEDAAAGGFADLPSPLRSELAQVFGDLVAISGDEQFALGLEKQFDAFPFVRNEADAPAAVRLRPTAGGGEKP